MPTFRATTSSGAVTEYDAALPQSEHLGEGWQLEELIIALDMSMTKAQMLEKLQQS